MLNNTIGFELLNSEMLCHDVDEFMEEELKMFHNKIKDIDMSKISEYENWTKVYKMLNYEIFDDIKINKMTKIANNICAVDLTFRKINEIDILMYIESSKTVTKFTVKLDKNIIKEKVIRRLLVPTTTEEALMYASRKLTEEDNKQVMTIIDKLKNKEVKTYKNRGLNNSTNNDTNKSIKEESKNVNVPTFVSEKEEYDYIKGLVKANELDKARTMLETRYARIGTPEYLIKAMVNGEMNIMKML